MLLDIGKPLGCTTKKMDQPHYLMISLWLLDAKVFTKKLSGENRNSDYFVSFYDTLESLAKKTLYDQEMLDKVFRCNNCKEFLEQFSNLNSQKQALNTNEENSPLLKIDGIRRYQHIKRGLEKNPDFTFSTFKLSFLVIAGFKIVGLIKKKTNAIRAKKLRESKILEVRVNGIQNAIPTIIIGLTEIRPKSRENEMQIKEEKINYPIVLPSGQEKIINNTKVSHPPAEEKHESDSKNK